MYSRTFFDIISVNENPGELVLKFFISAFRCIIRRPILIWFIALLLFPVVFLSNRFSLLRYIPGEQGIGSLNIFDTYLLILQIAVKYLASFRNLMLIMLSLIVFAIISGLLSGVFFSGYFHILHKTLNSYKPKKNDYLTGLKKNFFSVFKVVSVSFILLGIVISMISFIFVPSIVTLNALLAGKAELFFILVLFLIVTVFVLFFSFTFFRIYMLYWLPACVSYKKKSFRAGRYVVDNNFWRSMLAIFLFDIIFIFSRYMYFTAFININSAEIIHKAAETRMMILNWLFLTVYVYMYIHYLFYSFKNSKEQVL